MRTAHARDSNLNDQIRKNLRHIWDSRSRVLNRRAREVVLNIEKEIKEQGAANPESQMPGRDERELRTGEPYGRAGMAARALNDGMAEPYAHCSDKTTQPSVPQALLALFRHGGVDDESRQGGPVFWCDGKDEDESSAHACPHTISHYAGLVKGMA
jgi:hypothetical protein